MPTPTLSPIKVTDLDISANPHDLRQDMHTFINYIIERETKRSYRENALPKSDLKRLAKAMGHPDLEAAVNESGGSTWIDLADRVSLALSLVSYDIQGDYMGYRSSEPVFPDNYIELNDTEYSKFLAMSQQQVESKLLSLLVDNFSCSYNELFHEAPLGMLETFGQSGCATGVVPQIKFNKTRKFLLTILAACKPGTWYSTASLVAYLKQHHPYFLIPANPTCKESWRKDDFHRYVNFHEKKGDRWSDETIDIKEDSPNAFERVEGRFVERFLEYIPLTMGYVEVAYGPSLEEDLHPCLGRLRAFKVNPTLAMAVNKQVPTPKVMVQPNFEVMVESPFYPFSIMDRLQSLGSIKSRDVMKIVCLEREKVARYKTDNPDFDVVKTLSQISAQPLPQNVIRELQGWSGLARQVTVFMSAGLWEGKSVSADYGKFVVEKINPGLRIVRDPEKLADRLEQAAMVPVIVKHKEKDFTSLPAEVKTRFAKQARKNCKAGRTKVVLRQQVMTTIYFPDRDLLDDFLDEYLSAKTKVEVNRKLNSITYNPHCTTAVDKALEKLGKAYQIQVKALQ